MNDSKSAESAREPGHRGPIASSDNGCKNAYDETAYSSAVASVAGLDGHPPRTIVDRVAQRSAQAVNATNASEDKNANNYVPATAPKDLEKAADDNKYVWKAKKKKSGFATRPIDLSFFPETPAKWRTYIFRSDRFARYKSCAWLVNGHRQLTSFTRRVIKRYSRTRWSAPSVSSRSEVSDTI